MLTNNFDSNVPADIQPDSSVFTKFLPAFNDLWTEVNSTTNIIMHNIIVI